MSRFKFIVSLVALCLLAIPAFGQVVLKPKFKEGTSFKVREKTTSDQVLTLNGMPLPTKSDNTAVAVVTIGKKDEKGNLPIATKVESLVVDLTLPGNMNVHFDSAKPDEKASNPNLEVLLEIFRKLVGNTTTITLGPGNKVVSVEGIQEGSQADPDSVKEQFQQEIDRFPAEPIKPGDKWKRTVQQDLGQGQVFTFERDYEYVGPVDEFPTVAGSRKLDKVTATDTSVTYSTKGNAGLISVKKSDLTVESSKHTLLFDRESGRTVSSESEVKIKGPLSLAINNMDFTGELKLTLNQKEEEVKDGQDGGTSKQK